MKVGKINPGKLTYHLGRMAGTRRRGSRLRGKEAIKMPKVG